MTEELEADILAAVLADIRTTHAPNTYLQIFIVTFFLVGWDLRHQVLRPLLAYCTAPDDR
jgi:hypothetical protein